MGFARGRPPDPAVCGGGRISTGILQPPTQRRVRFVSGKNCLRAFAPDLGVKPGRGPPPRVVGESPG